MSSLEPTPATLESTAPAGLSVRGFADAGRDVGRWLLVGGAALGIAAPMFGLWPGRAFFLAASLLMVRAYGGTRRDYVLWTAYVVGILLFVDLRAAADGFGGAVRSSYVIAADHRLFGVVPTVWLQQRLYSLGSPSVLDFACLTIYLTYFLVPHFLVVALWRIDRRWFRDYTVAVLVCYYISLVPFILAPTAPPWLAGQTGYLPHVFRITRDILNAASASSYSRAYEVVGQNDVAAMPSLHTAITVVIAMALLRARRRGVRIAGWLYAAGMGFTLVYFGEHYVSDVLAGTTLGGAAWLIARRFQRREAPSAGVAGDRPASRAA